MNALNPRRALFTGSFDPPTLGHLDLARRGLEIFEHITLAVGAHPSKPGLFSSKERVLLLKSLFTKAQQERITVIEFTNLAIDVCRDQDCAMILRGLRSGSDFDYESQMAATNKAMLPAIDTLFLAASPGTAHISSTLVRQIASMGGDISSLVPPSIEAAVKAKS